MSDWVSREAVCKTLKGVTTWFPPGCDDSCKRAWIDGVSAFISEAEKGIRALPAAQIAVKPLEWKENLGGWSLSSYTAQADALGGAYFIASDMNDPGHDELVAQKKAAAQANHDARIWSQIIATPGPAPEAVAALVEALDKATSYSECAEHSRVGHRLAEASWHVHLAGFRSEGEAQTFLRAALARMEGK